MGAGHSFDAVVGYTPRQVEGLLFLAERRKRKEAALALTIATTGSRGEQSVVKKQLKDWTKD